MKKTVLFLLLLSNIVSVAQSTYDFDYLLVYKEKCMNHNTEVDILRKIKLRSENNWEQHDAIDYAYAVNSANNNYYLQTNEDRNQKDKQNFELNFHAYTDKKVIHVRTRINIQQLYKTKKIISECSRFRTNEQTKETTDFKEFYFENYKDTIINDTSYYHYALRKIEKVVEKDHCFGSVHYVVYKNNPNFLPMLDYIGQFVWNRDKNIPNGYLKLRYHANFIGEIRSSLELKEIFSTQKQFVIPKECEEKEKMKLARN